MSDTTLPIVLDSLDLAALLCSRVCHDVINPVGAINNGLEMMELETDPAHQKDNIDLIRSSAAVASARLQFCRIAFGAAGSAGSSIDLGDAEKVARGFFQSGKATLEWNAPRLLLAKNKVKLLLNLLVIAEGAIVRGGVITLKLTDDGGANTVIDIAAKGTKARIPPHCAALLAGRSETGVLDSHSVGTYYAGRLAEACGMDVTLGLDGEVFSLTARPAVG